jgi:hypothetical protein
VGAAVVGVMVVSVTGGSVVEGSVVVVVDVVVVSNVIVGHGTRIAGPPITQQPGGTTIFAPEPAPSTVQG